MNASVDDGQGSPEIRAPAPALEKKVAFEAVGRRLLGQPFEPITLGRFLLMGCIGRGGMGTVFKAYDESLDRAIAIKVLHSGTSRRQAERLQREAMALAKLSHPNVVQVYEVGRSDHRSFIAMELVTGQTLRRWHEGDHDWRARVQMYVDAGAGLAAAHAVGLVHRDFKPDNCIVDAQGRPRVLDFGLVRDAGSSMSSTPPESGRVFEGDERLTDTGAVMGTRGYMPPEQVDGTAADAHSDQFGFCVSLFEALYAELPFDGRTLEELKAQMKSGAIRPAARGTAVPEAVRRIVVRGLAPKPSERWASMNALLDQLRTQVTPRTRRWLPLLLGAGMLGGGVGLASYAEVGLRCDGGAFHLRGTWDETRRAEVREALLSTGLSYADDAWLRVEARLDDYAARWTDKRTDACEATSVRQEQSEETMDLRIECLRVRRVAMEQSIAVLADAGEHQVVKAVELVADLPSLSRCDDVTALRAQRPPPEDPAVAIRIAELRERLERASSLKRTGQFDQALSVVDDVVTQAGTLDYPPLLAEALFVRGRIRAAKGEYLPAEQDLERAYVLAAEDGDDMREAQAAAWLVDVVGARGARHQEGLWWGRTALALARGPNIEPQVEGRVLANVGLGLRLQGHADQALDRFERSLEILRHALAPNHPDIARGMLMIGSVLRTQGQLDEALDYNRGALAIAEESLGPNHPAVAAAWNNIGTVLRERGEDEEALASYRRAAHITERAMGPTHPNLASMHNNIGNLLQAQGRLDEALGHHRRALDVWEQSLGPRHPTVADSLNNLASLLAQREEYDEALEFTRRALSIREQTLGHEHFDTANSHHNLGTILGYTQQYEPALDHFRTALAIYEALEAPPAVSIAKVHHNLGTALQTQGQFEDAKVHEQRSLDIYEEQFGTNHPEVGRCLLILARIHRGLGDDASARASAERSISIYEQHDDPSQLARARFELARALWSSPDQRERASTLVQSAQAFARSEGDGQASFLARVEAWTAERPR